MTDSLENSPEINTTFGIMNLNIATSQTHLSINNKHYVVKLMCIGQKIAYSAILT